MTADKIRFFAHAYAVASEDALVPIMTDPAYAGGLLFVLPVEGRHGSAGSAPEPVTWAAQQPLLADDSMSLLTTGHASTRTT